MLIFGEINDSAVARESSKLFSLDGRYDVVSTGSLLGVSDLSIKHIPSGYDEYLTQKPLNFIEFIQDQNISDLAFETIRSSINNKTELNDGIDVIETKANNGRIISAKKLAMNETSFRIHKVYKLIKNGYGNYYLSF